MREIRHSIFIVFISFLFLISCDKEEPAAVDNEIPNPVEEENLPERSGARPETTTGIPHVQIGVEPVPEVHEEMIRRIYAIPGIEDQPSVIAAWRGLWLKEDVSVLVPDALISGREFAHIHDDGSLHIFLEPIWARQAVKKGWAVFHPYAVQELQGWDGFIMLYTPQSFEELDVVFRLIVDGFNYVSGEMISPTDFYES